MSEYTTVETHILNDLQAAAENLLNKYNALRAENDQLRSSKRELVEALENLYHHVKNGQEHQCCIYCANVKAAIAKHREE